MVCVFHHAACSTHRAPTPRTQSAETHTNGSATCVQLSGVQAATAASDAAAEAQAAAVVLRCLFEAWHECLPADMSRQPDVGALECLVLLLESALMLLRMLGVPGAHSGGLNAVMKRNTGHNVSRRILQSVFRCSTEVSADAGPPLFDCLRE